MTKFITIIAVFFSVNLMAQTPCVNGEAGGFPCNQIDFYANLDNAELAGANGVAGSDIWGWTDPQTGIEYAIMGQTNGIVFVDISNPSSPVIVGRLPSHTGNASSWRDVKVYNNHAFVVADSNPGHGMQVFDLTRLRNAGSSIVTFNNDAHYSGVSSAHNIVINEATGYAYLVGARNAGNGCGVGGLHIVNIQDPSNPVFAGCFDADGYTHDAQCVIYNGPDQDFQGQEICFNSNENTITIANVNDKGNTSLIAKSGYPESSYSHQGWLTEDHQYFISNDELDERSSGFNTRTLIWDVRDLNNPVLMNQHYSETSSIDHNLYIRNNRIYQSNYTSGVVILDANRINSGEIRERASFDTYPASNGSSFDGSWSNYPFFESGVLIVSDINNGLFVLQPNLSDLIASHPTFESCDDDNSLTVAVNSGQTVDGYQWQMMIGDDGAENLQNDDDFSGVDSEELIINLDQEGISEMRFRCKVTFENGEIAYTYYSNSVSGLPSTSFGTELNNLEVAFINNTSAATIYEWDFGDGSEISTEENPIHVYEEVGIYEVTLVAANDCGSESYSYTVNLSPCIPEAGFTYDNIEEQFYFYSTSDSENEFEWDFGDGSATSNETNPVHQFADPGVYTVTLVVRNECGESSYSETLNVDCVPVADFTYDTVDGQFNFYSSSNSENEFEWDFGDGSATSNEANPVHQFEGPGVYTVTLVVRNECGESSYSETLNIAEILSNDESKIKDLQVFPNPFKNVLNLNTSDLDEIERLEIIDQSGRKLVQIQNFNLSSDLSFSTDYWKRGMYYIVLTQSNGSKEVRKVIKQ